MSLEKSEAIIIRSVDWSETSLVVTLWTREFGKVSAIARGARRPKSPFDFALDLLSQSFVVFIAKSGDTLDLLTEAKLVRRFRSGQQGLLPLYCGYYVAELLNVLTEHHQPIPGLFDVTDRTLRDLDNGVSPSMVVLRFELHTLRCLGHMPSFEFCIGCGEESDPEQTTVAFTSSGGGFVCPRCSPMQRHVMRIGMTTMQILRRTAHLDTDQPLPETDSDLRGEIRFVMDRVIGHLVDRRLRVAEFLEELKR
jgi:DNA repair protein RecO (recombination protein O)